MSLGAAFSERPPPQQIRFIHLPALGELNSKSVSGFSDPVQNTAQSIRKTTGLFSRAGRQAGSGERRKEVLGRGTKTNNPSAIGEGKVYKVGFGATSLE